MLIMRGVYRASGRFARLFCDLVGPNGSANPSRSLRRECREPHGRGSDKKRLYYVGYKIGYKKRLYYVG
jgi:hypothetical protein